MEFHIEVTNLTYEEFQALTAAISAIRGPAPAVKAELTAAKTTGEVEKTPTPGLTVAAVRIELGKHLEGPLGKKLKGLIKEYDTSEKPSLATIPADKLSLYLDAARKFIKENENAPAI